MVASPFLRIEEDTEPLRVNPPRSLRASDFLVGNPGIQGSNLVCGLSVLLEASLFDESLPNCTDRDPCICDARPWTSHRYPGSSASFTRTAPSISPSEPAREPRRCGSWPPCASGSSIWWRPLQWLSVLDPNEVLSDRSRDNATPRVRASHHCRLDQIRSPRPRSVRSRSEHEPDNDRANTPTTTPIDGLSYLSSDSAG